MAGPSFFKSIVVGASLVASSSLWAVECAEVVWTPSVLERYPGIYNACQAVVEKDGKHFVELDAKFVSYHDHKARLSIKSKDGTYDKTVETHALPEDFKVIVDGKQELVRKLERDTELTIYVPSDRFVLVSDLAQITVVYEFEDAVPAPAKK
jgi:hypothetical protein